MVEKDIHNRNNQNKINQSEIVRPLLLVEIYEDNLQESYKWDFEMILVLLI